MKNNIIITNNETKKKILKDLHKITKIKIYTLNEFIKLYYFSYTEETIYYLINKYHIKYEIAKIYLDNLIYIEDKKYNSSKLNFLSDLKKELLNNNLIKINKLFKNSLKNNNIYIYNLPTTLELNKLIEELRIISNVEIHNQQSNKYQHPIYELTTIEDEVVFVATKICELINKGISPNNIYLTNIDNEYKKVINRIFPMYHIPLYLDKKESIYGTYICQLFLNNYQSNLEDTFTILKDYIKSPEDESIFNKLIDIVNSYTFIDDKLKVQEMIKYDIKHTYIEEKKLSIKVSESSLNNIYNDDDYVFLLSFNQRIIPCFYKDENYLNDSEASELNISLTIDKNNSNKEETIQNILSIPNLIITYKKENNGEEFTISNINEQLQYEIIKNIELDYTKSNKYNKIKLTSLLDEYIKYNTKSDTLFILNKHYNNLNYKTYDNVFTGIDKKDLQEYLDNKLNLSYTKLDLYYKCPFSYYISNILKLNKYEENFYQLIGTLFHSVLEKFNNTNLSYDELINSELNKIDHQFTNKEKFFIEKLKKELLFVIETIKNQEIYTNLHDELHEEEIYTNIPGTMKITFKGIIDKVKYKKDDNETIIAIIDYKTGNPNLDLTTIPYGLSMQLPIYLYLAKNSHKLINVKVAGFYLQKILHNEITVDKSSSYEQEKKKALKLQGFSNSDMSILKEFDSSYLDSSVIQGMKVTKDNDFYHYTKVLSTKQMDILSSLVEDKIKEGAHLIENATFPINPKVIKDKNYSCSYCKFKDICFYKNSDIIELVPKELKDIIGGDNNESN